MNKNVIAVFTAVCGLFMASCGTPSDQRPGEKVSVDLVEPGTRNTFNVSDAGEPEVAADGTVQHEETREEVIPGRERGGNEINPADSTAEEVKTNSPAGATKYQD